MSANDVDEFVKRYLVDEVLDGRELGIHERTPLLEWGILNSMEMMRLVRELESEFAVRLPHDALKPENFRDIASIRDLVLQLDGQV